MFEKIKDFLMKLFGIRKQELLIEPAKPKIVSDVRKEEFENNIKVSIDKEEQRILKLKNDFEAGIILEEELSQKDFDLLYDLYEKQIQLTKASIQNYKEKIIALKGKMA